MKTELIEKELKAVVGKEIPPILAADFQNQVVQLCRQADVGFYQTLQMVLRAEWLSQKKKEVNFHFVFQNAQMEVQEQKQLLARNSNNYFKLFEENAGGWASKGIPKK